MSVNSDGLNAKQARHIVNRLRPHSVYRSKLATKIGFNHPSTKIISIFNAEPMKERHNLLKTSNLLDVLPPQELARPILSYQLHERGNGSKSRVVTQNCLYARQDNR